MTNQPIDEAADKIIQDLGLDNINETTKQELVATIKDRVAKRVMATMVENLQPNDLEEMNKMVESGKTEEEILQAMADGIPDLQTKVNEALAALYDELMADVQAIKQQV